MSALTSAAGLRFFGSGPEKPTTVSSRSDLLHMLRGNKIYLPDLASLFQHWPQSESKNLNALQAALPERAAQFSDSEEMHKVLCKTDAALFVAKWWPGASLEVGEVLVTLILWLFCWDDFLDNDHATDGQDIIAARLFYDESIAYVEYYLGLADQPSFPPSRVMSAFSEVGELMCSYHDIEQRKFVFNSFRDYMNSVLVEQARRLSPLLPTVLEYFDTRMGTSAVDITSFMNK
ncbi:hypothetical protein CC79DRAFT_1374251 [Sarocladium strictum]